MRRPHQRHRQTITRTLLVALAFALAAPSLAADPKPDAKQLAADRVATAKKVLELIAAEEHAGVGSFAEVPVWSMRLLDAQLDDPATTSRPRALQDYLDRMTAFRDDMVAHNKAMTVSARVVAEAEYYLAEAKVWVARGRK